MARNLLDRVPAAELEVLIEKLLVLLPADLRPNRIVDDLPVARYFAGADVKASHLSFVKAMLGRIRSAGITAIADVFDFMHLVAVAIERVGRMGKELPVAKSRDLLRWLRESDQVPALIALLRQPNKARAIDLLAWILFRQHHAESAERISFDVLRRRVPGFGDAYDADAIAAFQATCRRAFARGGGLPQAGKDFEKVVEALEQSRLLKMLNDVTSAGTTKKVGKKTLAGDAWRFDGRDYVAGANFDLFDYVVRGANNRTMFGSCADGRMAYLIEKFERICVPSGDQFQRVVEELRFLAEKGKLPNAASLANMKQEAACREVARRAALLVHPDCVAPLRAVIESSPKLEHWLTELMAVRGLTDRARALEDMLGSILPAVELP